MTPAILIAGHGTVDSRGAYIVTYDSDPQDLSSTALPMAEIQQHIPRHARRRRALDEPVDDRLDVRCHQPAAA